MLSKIYFGVLGIATVAMTILAYLCYGSLQSRGFAPQIIADSFDNYSNIYWTVLWISGAVLLLLSNMVFLSVRTARNFWISFLFFATFVILQTWYLSDLGSNYKKIEGLGNGSFYGIGGVIICLAVGIGVFCNQFIISRLQQKISGTETVVDSIEETPSKQPEIE